MTGIHNKLKNNINNTIKKSSIRSIRSISSKSSISSISSISSKSSKSSKSSISSKSSKSFISYVIILSLCFTVLIGCEKKDIIIPTLLDPVTVKLDTETVVRDTIYDIDLYEGSVVPYTEGVYFEEDSKIAEVLVGVGDSVTKGQALLRLDRTKWQEEVDALIEEITYTENNNRFTNQQTTIDTQIAKHQLTALIETGTDTDIALKKLDIKVMEEQSVYAESLQNLEINQKKNRLELLKQQLSQSDLLAPFSGTVVYCENLHEGSTVQAYNPVIYLADDKKMTLQTAYIAKDVITDSQDFYAMLGDQQYSITNVPYSDEDYKYKVYNKLTLKSNFAIEDETAYLECGRYAAICFTRSYAEDVLVVPKKALYRDGAVRYVYKIIDGQRVRQEVEIGISTRIKAEITNGLSEGDEVYVQQ